MSTDFSKCELTGLPFEFFIPNREKFFLNVNQLSPQLEKDSILVLKGGDELPKYDTDISYVYFSQEANFYYLTGVRDPGFDAIVDFSSNSITLFYDLPPDSTKYWQTVLSVEEMKERYKLNIYVKTEINEWIMKRNPKKIFRLEGVVETSGLPVFSYKLGFEGKYEVLNEKISSDLLLYKALVKSRRVKSKEEIELMRFISNATNETHKEIMKRISVGQYERDVENVFNNHTSNKYYTRIWGYPCICGVGVNAATLHYEDNTKLMNDGQLFLGDMGMRFCNYVTDVTITIPVNGKYTQEQIEIYELVLKSNRSSMSLVRSGIDFKEIDKHSKIIILEGLQGLGFINKGFSVSELYEKGVHKYFYPHSLGHYVGIEVHDVNRFDDSKDYVDRLEEGNVITIEPGVYFREFLLEEGFNKEELKKYFNIEKCRSYFSFGGVRIEDDVLVLNDGYENLNKDLPREVKEIEEFMRKN